MDYGNYYLRIEMPGYQLSQVIEVSIKEVTTDKTTLFRNVAYLSLTLSLIRNSGFYYSWNRSSLGITVDTMSVIVPQNITFIDDAETAVSKAFGTERLANEYDVYLVDTTDESWNSIYVERFYELYSNLPSGITKYIKSQWKITNTSLHDDIEFTNMGTHYDVIIAKDALKNMVPRAAEVDGKVGSYFSKRFYHALLRFITNNGKNDNPEIILNVNFANSFNVPNYRELTAGTTDENENNFQSFLPEEKLLVLMMFEEMPTGMHKMPELKYLVRRKNGQIHPLYPAAAAVAWPTVQTPYIEFVDIAFYGGGYYDTKRLLIHEKMHMYWEHYFSEELKEQWCEIGSWFEDPLAASGWSTTKQVEFVGAYAHDINPDEDMAETAATYIINANLVKSRAPEKYDFIKKYIMDGNSYLLLIPEHLTFEVYNLSPSYVYPGQIQAVEVVVKGEKYEDKYVEITIALFGDNAEVGAKGFYLRLFSPDGEQFYDIRGLKNDEKGLVLRATTHISKYSQHGVWTTDNITLSNSNNYERYLGRNDFSLQVFIDNPLEDLVEPFYVRESISMNIEPSGNAEHPNEQLLTITIKFEENVELQRAVIRIGNLISGKKFRDIDGIIDNNIKESTFYYIVPEHFSTGIYTVESVSLWDKAGNHNTFNFGDDYAVENNSIYIETVNPDDTPAVLDTNDIMLTAVPTNPLNPDGETLVTLRVLVSDDNSGLNYGGVNFIDPQGNLHHYYIYFPGYLRWYDKVDATVPTYYTFTFTLPKGSAPGIWGLYDIYLNDLAGNISIYTFVEIVHIEIV